MVRGYLKVMMLKCLDDKELTGYDLTKIIGEHTGKKPSAGAVYPLLADLVNDGFLQYRQEGKKKFYTRTPEGEAKTKQLLKEKEDVLAKSLQLLRTFQHLDNREEIKHVIRLLEQSHEGQKDLLCMAGAWLKLKAIILKKLSKENKETEDRILSILESTVKQIRQLK